MDFTKKSFSDYDFQFDNFLNLNESDLIEILFWRNADSTRKWMKSNELISESHHLEYCRNLVEKKNVAHWRLSYKKRYVGVISMNEWFDKANSCEWGFYLTTQSIPEDSLLIFYAALKLFFENLSFSKLHGSIKTSNKSAILLNTFFQFAEIKTQIIENEEYSIRELDKATWQHQNISIDKLVTDFFNFYILNKRENANR